MVGSFATRAPASPLVQRSQNASLGTTKINPAECYETDIGVFTCHCCADGFDTASLLTNHMMNYHQLNFRFRCCHCGVGTCDEGWLVKHQAKCFHAVPVKKEPKEGEENIDVQVHSSQDEAPRSEEDPGLQSNESRRGNVPSPAPSPVPSSGAAVAERVAVEPFACDLCSRKFPVGRSLNIHRANVHGILSEKGKARKIEREQEKEKRRKRKASSEASVEVSPAAKHQKKDQDSAADGDDSCDVNLSPSDDCDFEDTARNAKLLGKTNGFDSSTKKSGAGTRTPLQSRDKSAAGSSKVTKKKKKKTRIKVVFKNPFDDSHSDASPRKDAPVREDRRNEDASTNGEIDHQPTTSSVPTVEQPTREEPAKMAFGGGGFIKCELCSATLMCAAFLEKHMKDKHKNSRASPKKAASSVSSPATPSKKRATAVDFRPPTTSVKEKSPGVTTGLDEKGLKKKYKIRGCSIVMEKLKLPVEVTVSVSQPPGEKESPSKTMAACTLCSPAKYFSARGLRTHIGRVHSRRRDEDVVDVSVSDTSDGNVDNKDEPSSESHPKNDDSVERRKKRKKKKDKKKKKKKEMKGEEEEDAEEEDEDEEEEPDPWVTCFECRLRIFGFIKAGDHIRACIQEQMEKARADNRVLILSDQPSDLFHGGERERPEGFKCLDCNKVFTTYLSFSLHAGKKVGKPVNEFRRFLSQL